MENNVMNEGTEYTSGFTTLGKVEFFIAGVGNNESYVLLEFADGGTDRARFGELINLFRNDSVLQITVQFDNLLDLELLNKRTRDTVKFLGLLYDVDMLEYFGNTLRRHVPFDLYMGVDGDILHSDLCIRLEGYSLWPQR